MKGVNYKFGQKKVLEEAYGGKILPFSKTLATYKDVSDITKKEKINLYLTVKGVHPSVDAKKGAKIAQNKEIESVSFLKKRGRKKKIVDEPIIEEEEIKVPNKSPRKEVLISTKDKRKQSTKKVFIEESSEEIVSISTSKKVNYPKDPFLLPAHTILNKINLISFPMTNILLFPTKKEIKIQSYGAKDNVGLEKKKEETKAILSVLEKIDYRKLDGYREGNRKIKYLKPELMKFAKDLRLPIKTGDKRDFIANQIKKKYDASGYSKKK